MIKGVIFDIDGVIIDSEDLHFEALLYAIKCVVQDDIEVNGKDLIGLSLDKTIEKLDISEDKVEKIKEISLDYYMKNVSPKLLRPGIKKLWNILFEKNIAFGCVSTAELSICKTNISQLELRNDKDIPLIGFESVEHCKPHPMPYLVMLNILGLKGHEVIVIEDSDIGIESASLAGISNIYAWPHKLSGTQKYKKAKKIIQNLNEIEYLKRGLKYEF